MRRERHNFFLCRLFHLSPSTCSTPAANYWSGFGELRKSTFFNKPKSQQTAFFQIPQILSASWHDVVHVPGHISYLGFLLWHLWLSHPPRAHVNTCTQLTHALTNPYTKRKVLSLTKPKGKIYKTKNDNIKKIPPQLYYVTTNTNDKYVPYLLYLMVYKVFGGTPFTATHTHPIFSHFKCL